MQGELVAKLRADAGVQSALGGRIWWNVRPQISELPGATMSIASRVPQWGLRGRSDVTEYVVRVNVWGADYASATTAAQAVEAAISGFRGPDGAGGFFEAIFLDTARGGTDDGGPGAPSPLHRWVLDFEIHHKEA
jgi:hypothetical protein